MIQSTFIQQGWECPKCKRVYSPTTSMCSHCPEYSQGYISTGTTLTVSSNTYSHAFESDKKSTSKTKCIICGLEKWQHPNTS